MADRSADEVKTLRLAARDRAAVCADCFALLAPAASITMKWRFVEHVTKRTFDPYAPEREVSRRCAGFGIVWHTLDAEGHQGASNGASQL
jgi:hypothetical protein